jgi:spore coat protein A
MMILKRKFFIGAAILAVCALSVPSAFADWDPAVTPKYAVDMPVLLEADLRISGRAGIRVNMVNSEHDFALQGTTAQSPMTPIYAYQFPGKPPTYPGATIIAERDRALEITWTNMLDGARDPFPTGHVLDYLVDTSLHMAHPDNGVPVVAHVHGGHTESASDGLPEAWFTQNWVENGKYFVKRKYHYDNDQEAGTIWYHDHALGITRLNVYAGLAGFYLIRDANEAKLIDDGVIPSGAQEIEIAIQDRMFTNDKRLTLPIADEPEQCPLPDIGLACDEPFPVPSIVAEFFGDHIVVNGKSWPKLAVGQGKYRLRLLNGSDSRFYVLQLREDATNGDITDDGDYPFWVIGTDDGFLDEPVVPESGGNANTLLIAPGERYDVVVDFSSFDDGDMVYLRNFGADSPFKGFNANGTLISPEGPTVHASQVMRFDVDDGIAVNAASVTTGTDLRQAGYLEDIPDAFPTDNERSLVLFEGLDNFGRLQPLLGTLEAGSLVWEDTITENPALNDSELWEVFNVTEDAHPIHLHLVAFRIVNRQVLDDEEGDNEVFAKPQLQHDATVGQGAWLKSDTIAFDGGAAGPNAWEDGWKDTMVMLPGQVSRVWATFDRPGRYVWHCHILSHEDHEMMRPYHVGPIPVTH